MNEAPATPTNDPAPPAPDAPVAPVTPVVPAEPSTEDIENEASDKEWEDAQNELFPGLKGQKKEPKKDEPAKPEKTAEEIAKEEALANETPEQKAEREAKEAEETAKPTPPSAAERDARNANRNYTQQVETIKSDVMEQMFADTPQTLEDADGDPIHSIDDVVKLINPRTGEVFTEDEAGMWLLSAQQRFNQNRANIEKQAGEIAEVNYEIKDQADAINEKYGEYLKKNKELRDDIWKDFQETLVKDKNSGVITKMPVSLERFYERALAPLLKAENTPQAAPEPTAEEKAAEAAKAEAEAKSKRQKARTDRSDIYAPNSGAPIDEDAQEWADAATVVFGPPKK